VGVGPEEGLRQRSVINLDDIDTIPKKQLDRRITVLTPAKMAEVNAAIKYALDLD
jgi:mRNA-degrading endonuclease toxin of MazEF toxin-antitoxin module